MKEYITYCRYCGYGTFAHKCICDICGTDLHGQADSKKEEHIVCECGEKVFIYNRKVNQCVACGLSYDKDGKLLTDLYVYPRWDIDKFNEYALKVNNGEKPIGWGAQDVLCVESGSWRATLRFIGRRIHWCVYYNSEFGGENYKTIDESQYTDQSANLIQLELIAFKYDYHQYSIGDLRAEAVAIISSAPKKYAHTVGIVTQHETEWKDRWNEESFNGLVAELRKGNEPNYNYNTEVFSLDIGRYSICLGICDDELVWTVYYMFTDPDDGYVWEGHYIADFVDPSPSIVYTHDILKEMALRILSWN